MGLIDKVVAAVTPEPSDEERAETRAKRIGVALSKLTAGNRRPCCFDRSGMYSNSMAAT